MTGERFVREDRTAPRSDVVLGEDWVSGDDSWHDIRAKRRGRGILTLNRSPLARKIITFNLLGLIVLIAGVFYLNPFRDSLALQREAGLVAEARLVADVFEMQIAQLGLPGVAPFGSDAASPVSTGAVGTGGGGTGSPESSGADTGASTDGTLDAGATLATLDLSRGAEALVFTPDGRLLARSLGANPEPALSADVPNTVITDFLNWIWSSMSALFGQADLPQTDRDAEALSRQLIDRAGMGETVSVTGTDADGAALFAVAVPVRQGGEILGVVALASAVGEIDALVRAEREQVLQVFVIAILVSVGLSLVLASTIANPLADLASAAELGRDRNTSKVSPGRVRIPDLAGRPDEIGRLSKALRGMVGALYDRIDGNEQFAADVAHEIKNPLASLRSAVGTLRVAKRDDQREKLLDVIDHDVRRLDRLVSDISNASRLDSELVKEEEESFDLLRMIGNLTEYLGEDAKAKGIDFITDMPRQPIRILGLEARLAQVFVNLITNAVSFCEEGDAVRVWVRKRQNRVLVVVEDTGPGIPEQALTKIFARFYSERPVGQFGDHSGLGLAISKQIIEAHGGVIWAENIRPTDADDSTAPLGARFVVGLPV